MYAVSSARLQSDVDFPRINEIEAQIGAGLIEEVIQVAEGEHQLVSHMMKNRP